MARPYTTDIWTTVRKRKKAGRVLPAGRKRRLLGALKRLREGTPTASSAPPHCLWRSGVARGAASLRSGAPWSISEAWASFCSASSARLKKLHSFGGAAAMARAGSGALPAGVDTTLAPRADTRALGVCLALGVALGVALPLALGDSTRAAALGVATLARFGVALVRVGVELRFGGIDAVSQLI